MLPNRNNDRSSDGFTNFRLMSLQFWGENPRGNWEIEFQNRDPYGDSDVTIHNVKFYGIQNPTADIGSAHNCGASCDQTRGCGRLGKCDACAAGYIRNTGHERECVTQCPSGFTEEDGYCDTNWYNPGCHVNRSG